jgi:hypothetical protein
MTTEEAAVYLRLAPSTLVTRRARGGGPKYVRAAGRVYYRRVDLDAYLDGRTYTRTLDSRPTIVNENIPRRNAGQA